MRHKTMKRFSIFVASMFLLGIWSICFAEGNIVSDVFDTAYDATSWDGKTTEAASKNAIRDKLETMGSGATAWDNITNPDANDTINMTNYIIQLQLGASGDFRIGDGGSNYTKFGTNGTITFHGSAEINEVPLDSDFSSNGRMERKGAGDYVIASTDYVNASWYGSGYAAIQSAIDTGAARVYVPSGTWSVTGNGTTTNGIRLRSNLELFGDGANETIISQAASSYFAIAVGTEASEGGNTTADNYKNIYIHDLQILGDVITSGFSEHYHTMSISGVSDVLIERVYFEGFRGDGLYLGSTHTGATERHNERVTIRDCIFDGINKDNRNGLTIIDCDGALIESNYFTRITKSTMPGAIDIEPNANNFTIIKDIAITDNKFYDIGGNVAAIAYNLSVNQATLTVPSQHVLIKDNHIDTCTGYGVYLKQTGTVSNSTIPNHIQLAGNSINDCLRGVGIFGVKDIQVKNNLFDNMTKANLLGYTATTDTCRDVTLVNNTFLHNGTSDGMGLDIFYADKITINNNIFNDCGNSTTTGYAINFHTGTSSYVRILNNTIIAPAGITTTGINKNAAHTFTSATNQYRGNDLHGLSSEFVSTNLWTDAEISDDLTLAKFQLDHNVETLAANKTLIITDKVIQKLDPDGTDRDILLPVENTATDLTFFIYNMGGEVGEDLNVQDDAAVDILSIGYLQLGFCTCDGTTWTVRCFSCAEAACCINLRAKEENTSAIVIGQPVYISGATGVALPNAGLADCDDSSKIRVKGLAAEDISQNSTGYIRVKGLLEDVNSTKGSPVNALSQDWTAGDQLWVSTTVGSLTNVRPIGRSVKIGTALTVEGVSSKILVDVRENSIYTGAASGEDIIRQMGDSAGANKIIYQDFGGNEIASLDSDGNAIYNAVTTDSIAVGAVASPRLRALDSDFPGTDKFAGSIDWQYVRGGDGNETAWIYLKCMEDGSNTTQMTYDGNVSTWKIPTGKHLMFGTVQWDLAGSDYMASASMEDGTVSGTEFKYINSLSSNAQDQIDTKGAIAGQVWTGTHDFGGANAEIPNSGTLPATCTVGQHYMDTNATTGQRFYLCETTNNWVLQGDGAGGGSGSMTTVEHGDVAVGGADIVVLDFLAADFVIAEDPNAEINISIDYPNGQVATTDVHGFLSDTDWDTFNNKQPTVSAGNISDNAIYSADINTIVESVVWNAAGMSADGTHCADPVEVTINSGPKMYTAIPADNDGSTLWGHIIMPDSWNAGTVTFELEYLQTAADTGPMHSDICAMCRGAGETVNNTWGSEVAIDDAAVTGSNAVDHTTSGAVTPNGTCVAGDTLWFKWQLDATGTTTAVATLHILGVKMEYTSNVGD